MTLPSPHWSTSNQLFQHFNPLTSLQKGMNCSRSHRQYMAKCTSNLASWLTSEVLLVFILWLQCIIRTNVTSLLKHTSSSLCNDLHWSITQISAWPSTWKCEVTYILTESRYICILESLEPSWLYLALIKEGFASPDQSEKLGGGRESVLWGRENTIHIRGNPGT